jgi:hypothetical protein
MIVQHVSIMGIVVLASSFIFAGRERGLPYVLCLLSPAAWSTQDIDLEGSDAG